MCEKNNYKEEFYKELKVLGISILGDELLDYYLEKKYNIDFIVEYLKETLGVGIDLSSLIEVMNERFGVERRCRNGGHTFYSMKRDARVCGEECLLELEKLGVEGFWNSCVVCEVGFESVRYKTLCSEKCKNKKSYNSKNEGYWSEYARLKRAEKKQSLVDMKGRACQKCGYNRNLSSLEFHHIDGTKELAISQIMGFSIKNIKKELDKCILLCSNCHTKEHSFIKEESKDSRKKIRDFINKQAGHRCGNCGEKDPNTFDFHHIDPKEKDFAISEALSKRWNIKKIVPELEKCTLLCRNCHREHHAGKKINIKKIKVDKEELDIFLEENGYFRHCKYCFENFYTMSQQDFLCAEECRNQYEKLGIEGYLKECSECNNSFVASTYQRVFCDDCNFSMIRSWEEVRLEHNKIETDKKNTCKNCNVNFYSTNDRTFCSSECQGLILEQASIENIERIFVESNGNFLETGRKLGISDNAVRKRLNKKNPELIEEYKKESIIYCKCCGKKYDKYNERGSQNPRYCSEECRVDSGVSRLYDEDKIIKTLKINKNNVSKTSKELNIPRTSLRNWIKKNT